MLAKTILDKPQYANTPGAIKQNAYPTSLLLRQSKMGSLELDSDCETQIDLDDERSEAPASLADMES